jgi:3,5-epimerase/4-reductase
VKRVVNFLFGFANSRQMAEFSEQREVYLIFGKNGWIGGKIIDLLTAQGKTFHLAESRTYNREAVVAEVEKYNPTHILNAAGVTGRPNVDWCEDHRLETIRSNVIGTLTVADVAEEVSACLPFHSPPFHSILF